MHSDSAGPSLSPCTLLLLGLPCSLLPLQTIEEQFKGTFDFFYLPIDFKNKCNVGYAFINMLQPQFIPPLVARFNNKRWDKFNSEKVRGCKGFSRNQLVVLHTEGCACAAGFCPR